MKRLIVVLVIVVVALGVFLAGRPSHRAPASPQDLQVSFLGFTNDSRLGEVALLCVTNGGDSAAYYSTEFVETLTPDGWVSAPAPPSARFGGALQPSQSFVWPVPLPVTNATWRVRVSCVEQAHGAVGAVHKVQDSAEGVMTGSKGTRFGGRHYVVLSPEVSK